MAFELLTAKCSNPTILKKIEYASNVPEEETLRDFTLIKQLMKHAGYEIPEHRREKLIERIFQTLETDLPVPALIDITNLVLKMDEHNLKMVSMAVPKKVVTQNTHTNARSLSDEALLAAVQEVIKKLPPTINASG